MGPRTATEAEDKSNAADRQAQKQQDETETQGSQQQTRRMGQPGRCRTSKEAAEETETDTQEEEKYANQEPGELERLLEEFMDERIATATQDTPEHKEENGRYEDKEDRASQRETEQQQTAEQENNTRRNPEEDGKSGDANT